MAMMTHAKFHFNSLMLTLRPGERLKRPGLIGLIKKLSLQLHGIGMVTSVDFFTKSC